jgi:DNA-binding NarL/FixJ family response regulator
VKEIEVANLITEGKSTKEIAKLLNSTDRAIKFHRANIRRKLGLKKTSKNLATYLLSLSK